MTKAILLIAGMSSFLDAYSQPHYSHARELGFTAQPKAVVVQTYEARQNPDSSFGKVTKYPYNKQVTRFDKNGNITNCVNYTFDNIHAPYTDTIDITRTEYKYNSNKCINISIYSGDAKCIHNTRTWLGDKLYIDSSYAYASASDTSLKLTSVSLVTLDNNYRPSNTKRTSYYEVMRGYSESNTFRLHLRPYEPPVTNTITGTETYTHTTRDEKGNIINAFSETGYAANKEYMLEEYSYEYY